LIIFFAEVTGQHAQLTMEESWHCSKVLRKKSGDQVQLIDGRGNFYEAVLDLVTEKKCTAKITHGPIAEDPLPYELHLAIAPTKQMDRTEWLIEKAVEVGISEISFFHSEHSEREVIKTERIMRIIESATKQSLRAKLPVQNEMVPLKELIKKVHSQQKYISHCVDLPKKDIREVDLSSGSITILIGPEGDFSRTEIDFALEKGFTGLSLGKARLRTETAGLFVCIAASVKSEVK